MRAFFHLRRHQVYRHRIHLRYVLLRIHGPTSLRQGEREYLAFCTVASSGPFRAYDQSRHYGVSSIIFYRQFCLHRHLVSLVCAQVRVDLGQSSSWQAGDMVRFHDIHIAAESPNILCSDIEVLLDRLRKA